MYTSPQGNTRFYTLIMTKSHISANPPSMYTMCTVHAHVCSWKYTHTWIQHILGQIHRPDQCVYTCNSRGWQPCRRWNSLWRPSFSVSFPEVTRRGKFCEHTQDESDLETPLIIFEQSEPVFPTRLGFNLMAKLFHVLAGPGDDQGPVRVLVF